MYGTITARDCTTFSASVVKWTLRHHPDAIFMAGRAYPKGRNLDKTPAPGPFKLALGQAMKAFRPSGADLYIMGPTPRYAYGNVGVEAKDCIVGTRPMKTCLLPPRRVVPKTELAVEQYYNDAGRIKMIDVRPLFCTTKTCTVFVNDGNPIYIPNAFTPNNDGTNDQFQVYGKGLKTVYMQIYDRYGELLFESNHQDEGWDGTYKGKPLPDATYYYVVRATYTGTVNVITLKGNVTIMR
jgi:gliding motility-associated-like protein